MTAFDYLIIVGKEDLMQSVYPLKVWKEQIGHSVKVASISDIYSQYTGDDATRIWKFLHYYYSRWGLRYVLLVGDIDQLPMRILYQDDVNGGYGSDYYYAKLSLSKWNDWDIDGDKRWGEFNDDNLDPTPDVLVGRIPFNDPKVVSNICLSIINFEQDIGSWKRNALLAHGIDDYNPGGKTDSAVLAEYLKSNVFDPQGWNCTTLYEKNGIPQGQSTYTCDYPLSETNFQKCYQLHDSSIINLAAHGHPALMQSHYWLKDIDGDGKAGEVDDVPEWGNTNFSEIKNLSAHAKSAANSNSAVVFLLGCSTGAVLGGYKDLAASNLYSSYLIKKPWDCIAKQYMRNGAAAVIASTAMAYYQQNWSQPSHGK
jgi:hypothetical protein